MTKPSLTAKLIEIRRREEEVRTKNLAASLNLPYLDLFGLPIDAEALKLLPEKTALQANLVVFHKRGRDIEIALNNPGSSLAKEILQDLKNKGYNYSTFLVSASGIKEALKHYEQISLVEEKKGGEIEISSALITRLKEEITDFDRLKEQIKQIPAARTSELLETLIAGALKLDASDVHLEPKENDTLLKYRLDGMLHEVVFLSNKTYILILSRIKLLSGMKLNIQDAAQDGRFTIRIDHIDIEIRSSVIPGPYGENIVMRVLNPSTIGLKLEELGFRKDLLKTIEEEIKKPNGLIITTGPTGSGKTTTLYAFIKKVIKPEVKIITLEDPVEYHLSGIVQTQVDREAGYTFASGLTSILRQDPDIILVGEIRDMETAKTALNASLTGHLVFSTLHTNDAAGAVPRFIDLGVDPRTLASSLNLMMAQRLVRRLCQKCRQKYNPPKEILEKIKNDLKGTKQKVDIGKGTFYKAKKGKCKECNGIGYKGRIGILELIQVDDEVEKLISKSPSHADVLELTKKKGMITMYQDALLKVLAGITTLEEVERVID